MRWYALAYVAGIMLGYYYIGWINRRVKPVFLNEAARDDMILYAVLGVILGGRIGYILFYNLPYYFDHPQQMLQVWHGGMSFHGGLSGVLLAFYLYARKHRLDYIRLLDYLAAATPIGLGLGRLANFVNGELYGKVTAGRLGMVFPDGGPLPRYPSQLFEATFEGLALFLLLFFLVTRTNALKYRGYIGGTFIFGYAVARFGIEFLREPDAQLGTVFLGLSMGQLLCLPMFALGGWALLTARHRRIK